jgi:hypothetical protein
MSGVAVIRSLLAANATLVAQVPVTRIFGGTVPLGTPVPAIGVSQVDGTLRKTVSMAEPKRLITDRVQVTVHTGAYDLQELLLELVRKACPNQHGTVNGVDLDSILPDLVGPDLYDTPTGLYEKSRDFIVKWRTA